jgi:hypothetical protein
MIARVAWLAVIRACAQGAFEVVTTSSVAQPGTPSIGVLEPQLTAPLKIFLRNDFPIGDFLLRAFSGCRIVVLFARGEHLGDLKRCIAGAYSNPALH